MRQIVSALAIIGICLLAAPVAHAFTCDTTGCTWQTRYTEPSALTNGQPIFDLADCTASYTVSKDGGPPDPTLSKSFTIPASKPTGGGSIVKNNSDPTMLPPHTYSITETVTCRSTLFGGSAPSAAASLVMNSGVAPVGATGVQLQ